MQCRTLLLMVIGFLLVTSYVAANEGAGADSLIVEDFVLNESGKAVVKVNVVNTEQMAALVIPLGFKGNGLLIDSISFAGGRVEYLKMLPVTISSDKKSAVFGAVCVTEDYIPIGNGLVATMFLSRDSLNLSDNVVIDTVTINPASMMFTKPNSETFIPTFVNGSLQKATAKEDSK